MKVKHYIFLFLLSIIMYKPMLGQEINFNDTVNISEIVVTANRSSRLIGDIPGRIEKIDAKSIEEVPVQNVDELLRNIANVHVNRSWGIFSQNASVTMRGLDGSARLNEVEWVWLGLNRCDSYRPTHRFDGEVTLGVDPDLPPLSMSLDNQFSQFLRIPEQKSGELSAFAVRFGEYGGAADHGSVHVELHRPNPQLVVTERAGQA